MNRRKIALLLFPALASVLPASGQTPPVGPLTLRRAAELALARAPEAASARAQAAEADADARAASAMFAPHAFATTTPGYSSGLPVAVAGRVPSVFGIEVHQTLYDPARRREVLEARVRAETFEAASSRSGAATARALVLSYGRNWSDRRRIETARRDLEAREAVLRRVAALAREGRRTDLDTERSGLEVARAKQALANREAESDLDLLELAWLTDFPRGELIQAAEDPLAALPEPGPGDHLAAARTADPELAALDRQTSALERAATFQRRAWLPVVQAEGQYMRLSNYNNFDQYFVKFKSNDWAVGISVALPLWTGGRLQHGRSAADARVEKIRADRRGRERDLELAVRRAEADLSRARADFQLSSRALAPALAAEGRGEADGVDLGEIAVAKAEDERADAGQGLLAARARLLELRGELPAALLGAKPSDRNPEVRKAEGTE
jgi:outer membrane protein TolC